MKAEFGLKVQIPSQADMTYHFSWKAGHISNTSLGSLESLRSYLHDLKL